MNKIFVLVGLLAVVAFAGTTTTTCTAPIELELDELYEGDTSAAETFSIQCNTYKYSPKGVWYHYKGQNKTVIFDTCDTRTSMDSVIFVFSSCDKDSQGFINKCVTMDDDGCNQRQSRVMFAAEEGKDYYVFVTGFLNSTGTYYLSTSEVLPPSNYQCSGAIDVPHVPFSIEGETGTCISVHDNCTRRFTAGLWYKLQATGSPYVAHTCNSNTNYDTVISVFTSCSHAGTGGGECVATNNDACYRASLVHWRSVQYSEYYIFVTGFNNARGTFTLAIEQRSMNPNSYCFEPIVITNIPFYYSASTEYMLPTFSECRDNNNTHAMYFRLQGSGRKLVATTCTSASTVNDSVIDVYSHCEDDPDNPKHGSGMQCVASNDDYCGLGAQVVFNAMSGSYYIAVSAASPSLEGVSFSLEVRAYEETKNSQCWFAEEVDSFPDVFVGNTTAMDFSSQSCDGSRINRRGGWYRYTHYGATKTVAATTCNKFNMLKTRLEVYHDCNEMGCVQQASPVGNCTTVSWQVENGKTYNIYVTAEDPNDAGGYYHVDFYEKDENEHSQCENAWFVQRGSLPYRLEDDTMTASESFSSCDNATMRGVWVAVIGTGNKMVATTCDSHTGYDTVLELYDRCPDEIERKGCLRVNDDNPSCGRSSEIEWASNSGQYYWLFVTGFAGSTGIFVLNIYEKVSMINAKCQNAVGIRSLPYYDYGLTTYCDLSNASCKKTPRKGNWYEIVGNDHWVTVSTCNIETDFATEVEVYLACSEDGGEICVNHNHDIRCAPKTEITFAAMKNELFYIFVTGVDEAVMEEGFFGLSVTQGEKLPTHLSSSGSEHPLTGGQQYLIALGVLMGVGVICAVCAVVYGMYKRRHLSYQEISTSG